MTTIVYRDGILAADSAINSGEKAVGTISKIVPVGDGHFIALAGCIGPNFMEVADWLSGWPEIGEIPECVKKGEVCCLFALKSGLMLQIDGGRPYEMKAPFFAEGSGKFIALGALAHGATAEQAVDIAIRYDNCSGGPTQTVRVV